MNELTVKELKVQCALGTMQKYTFHYRPSKEYEETYIVITAVADTREKINEIVNTYINTLRINDGKIYAQWDMKDSLSQEVWVTPDTSRHNLGSIIILYDEERSTDPTRPRDVDTILNKD